LALFEPFPVMNNLNSETIQKLLISAIFSEAYFRHLSVILKPFKGLEASSLFFCLNLFRTVIYISLSLAVPTILGVSKGLLLKPRQKQKMILVSTIFTLLRIFSDF
jgi:hypothetical protein